MISVHVFYYAVRQYNNKIKPQYNEQREELGDFFSEFKGYYKSFH